MARGGRSDPRRASVRRCIATGEVLPKSSLIRFVANSDGRILSDLVGRLPGRGIWVSADRVALETAVRKRLFSRGVRRQVWVPDSLADEVETLLVDHVVSLVSMARKAGQAVAGYEKTRS